MEPKQVLATFDDKTIRVYQAYNDRIADEALRLGTFGHTFKMERMTWIKPSFLWMMYRAGWGTKPDQERILAIDIMREGFDVIIANAVMSTYNSITYPNYQDWKKRLEESEVRCQWDPDRDIYGNPIGRRAIQLGLRGSFVKKYVNEWIVQISDLSAAVKKWREDLQKGALDENELPKEGLYPVTEAIQRNLRIKDE